MDRSRLLAIAPQCNVHRFILHQPDTPLTHADRFPHESRTSLSLSLCDSSKLASMSNYSNGSYREVLVVPRDARGIGRTNAQRRARRRSQRRSRRRWRHVSQRGFGQRHAVVELRPVGQRHGRCGRAQAAQFEGALVELVGGCSRSHDSQPQVGERARHVGRSAERI